MRESKYVSRGVIFDGEPEGGEVLGLKLEKLR